MPSFKQWLDKRPDRFPYYLFLVLLVLMALLILNGYIEIQRTRSRLFRILETEALLVIKGIEKNAGNLIGAFSPDRSSLSGSGSGELSDEILGIEDLLIERLINLALRMDQEAAPKNDLSPLLKERPDIPRDVFFIKAGPASSSRPDLPGPLRTKPPFYEDVLSGKTRLAVYRGEGPQRQIVPLAVAVGRRTTPGMILISLRPDEYLDLGRRIIIQGYLDEYSGKGNVVYLKVEDQSGKITAQQGNEALSAQGLRFKKMIRPGDPGLIWREGQSEDFLEIIRPFRPVDSELGQIRLGMSLKEINPIIEQARRTTLLTIFILLTLGMISIFIIFRLQGRHFKKMRELENQIRLQEELSAMGQLAAGVAHEIKNPLNAISLVVQRLQQEFHPPNPEERKEYDRFTGIVRNEISRVNRIIADFLMVAKPLEMRLEDCSVIEIINYVLEVLGEEFRRKNIRTIPEWEDPLPLVRSDRFQLTQVFINILNNAQEAMPEDGGEIHLQIRVLRNSGTGVRSEKRSGMKLTSPYLESTGDFLEIGVIDSGKGIPPDELKRIFAHYYTTKEKGVGLGLAITQKIISAHGGTLGISSRPGQGTTVTIRLPLTPPDS